MAQAARALEHHHDPVHHVALPDAADMAGTVVPVGDAAVAWSASPARALHEQLLQSFGSARPSRDDRLPLRVRLAVIAAAMLAPWLAAGVAWAVIA